MNYIRLYDFDAFWTNDGEDYPNIALFDNAITNYTEFSTKDISINWEGDLTARMTIKDNQPPGHSPRFPRYVSIHVVGKPIRYLTATNIHVQTNTTTTYNLSVDIWGTFCMPIIRLMNEAGTLLPTTRNHILNPRAYQLNDTLLNSIPLTFDKKNNALQFFPYTTTSTQTINTLPESLTETDRKITTDSNNLLNGNIYYVFNGDGKTDTTNYYFVPVLAKDAGSITYSSKPLVSTLEKTLAPSVKNYDATATQQTYQSYIASGLSPIQSQNYMSADTQPREVSTIYDAKCTPFEGRKRLHVLQEVLKNNEVVNPWMTYTKFSSAIYPDICPPEDTPFALLWLFYSKKPSPITNFTKINNTSDQVKALLNNTELINKFKGVFFLPNFINFSNNLTLGSVSSHFTGMLYFKMDATGIPLNLSLPWFNTTNIIPEYWNSTKIENLQVKAFENYSYYQNTKNWANYTDTYDLNLSGLFIFNGAGSFFPTSSRLKSVDAPINYPYQLPSATDGYIEYYSRNLSSVNNGINQQKIQYDLSKDRLIGGAVFGAASIASNAGPNISTALSAGSFAFNTAMSSRDLERQNQSYYKGLAAQYEDVQRTTGANFNTSNVNDSTNIIVQLNTPFHAEIMEKMDLNVETIKVLNNVLFLYGNLNVGLYDWHTLTQQYQQFNYIKFNDIDLSGIIINNEKLVETLPRNYAKMAVSFLAKGLRIINDGNCLPGLRSPNWSHNYSLTTLLRGTNGKDSK